jgi:4-amino-4-deoxy-L-arabinose transferase-like glycosyltransferase
MDSDKVERAHSTPAWHWLLLVGILCAAAYLRFTGLNWDEGQWIHPDEGHMRIITSVVHVPDSPALYFDTHNSPLNCRNSGYVYSYGTLPLFLTRWTAEWLDKICQAPAGEIGAVLTRLPDPAWGAACTFRAFTGSASALVGRFFSALFDVGTVVLVYLIGRRLYGQAAGLLAMAFAAFIPFTIQQAHFFTVDSAATFFMVLTAYFSVRAGQAGVSRVPSWPDFGLAGVATGLAAACKVSAALAALFVALAGAWWWLRAVRTPSPRPALRSLLFVVPPLVLAGALSLVAFRIAQPYAFEGPGFLDVKPSPEWFERLGQIQAEQNGEMDLPSGRQWTNRAPILFSWMNMVVWGMGLPLGLAAWAGWVLAGYELLRGRLAHLVLWSWATLLFFYQATRWVKAMRYFLPLYPLLAVLAAYLLVRIFSGSTGWRRWAGVGLSVVVVGFTVFWGLAVFSIYTRPNTRVAASRWIYEHVPAGSVVVNEHWDWGLPLPIDGYNPFAGMYTGLEMENYNEDTPEKLEQMLAWLDQADYVFLASNRLYASIPRLPARYPMTINYYRRLFSGELGFDLVADFTSTPALGPFQFPDQECPFPLTEAAYVHQMQPQVVNLPPAEEAFSVYDHPRVLIFEKTARFNLAQARTLLTEGVDWSQVVHGLHPQDASQ